MQHFVKPIGDAMKCGIFRTVAHSCDITNETKRNEMNINDLTFGQIKEIASMFTAQSNTREIDKPHPFVGQYVIIRSYSAGVHAGTLLSKVGDEVMLENSLRLWQWESAEKAVALSGVAQTGLKSGEKVDLLNPTHCINDVCEVIPCSDKATKSIRQYEQK